METIIDVLTIQGKVTVSCAEVWRSSHDFISLFGMDPMSDIDKDSSTHTIIEDVDTKQNLA
jgi:hypothetical protein